MISQYKSKYFLFAFVIAENKFFMYVWMCGSKRSRFVEVGSLVLISFIYVALDFTKQHLCGPCQQHSLTKLLGLMVLK